MSLLTSIRDLCRSRHDDGLPVARPIAEERPGKNACDTYECLDRLWCIQRDLCKRRALADDEPPVLDDATPIVFNLASIRACRPTIPGPDPEQIAAMVEAVTRCVVTAAGGKVTGRMRGKIEAGVRMGLVEIGVVR